MRTRIAIAAGLALSLGLVGCDKKEETGSSSAPAEAAKEAGDKAAEAADKAKEAADEAVGKAAEAAAEAAKKAEELQAAAEAEAAKKLEEAQAKAAEIEGAAAKKVEEAAALAAAEAAKKIEEDAAAQAETQKNAVLEKREDLIQLAVDLECLQKRETDAQRLLQEQTDLLAAAELDKRAYLNALEALEAADAEVRKQIDAAVEGCPSAEDIIRGKVMGVEVMNQCMLAANVKPARMTAIREELLETYELSEKQFTTLRDQYKDEPWFGTSLEEGTKSCPPIPDEAVETEDEAEAQLPADRKGKTKQVQPTQQSFKGTIFGSANGKITAQVRGRRITTGQVSVGSVTMRITGYVLPGGKISFSGKQGDNSIQGSGKFDRGGRIMGSWNGNLNGKRRSGSFILHR